MSQQDADMQPQPEQPTSPFLNEALGYLTGEGRDRTPATLLDDLRTRFHEAGREKLADLVYEMAKACLKQVPDFAKRFRFNEVPRQMASISTEMGSLSSRMDSIPGPDVVEAPSPVGPVEGNQALRDTRRCVSVLGQLEGDSERKLLIDAVTHAYAGELGEAENRLKVVLQRTSAPPSMHCSANTNMAFVLIRMDRDAEALAFAKEALKQDPRWPMAYTNIATASAKLGNREEFLWAIRKLRELHRQTPSEYVEKWFKQWLSSHTQQVGLSSDQIGGLEDQSRPSGQAP